MPTARQRIGDPRPRGGGFRVCGVYGHATEPNATSRFGEVEGGSGALGGSKGKPLASPRLFPHGVCWLTVANGAGRGSPPSARTPRAQRKSSPGSRSRRGSVKLSLTVVRPRNRDARLPGRLSPPLLLPSGRQYPSQARYRQRQPPKYAGPLHGKGYASRSHAESGMRDFVEAIARTRPQDFVEIIPHCVGHVSSTKVVVPERGVRGFVSHGFPQVRWRDNL